MIENLFLRLEKFSCNKKTSRENLFTELFAYLLDFDRKFKKTFLKKILQQKHLVNRFIEAEIITQKRMSDKSLIDIAFLTKKGVVYIENKIDSPEGKGKFKKQIAHYLDLLKKGDRLVYLTLKTTRQPEFRDSIHNREVFAGQYYWEDIYDLLYKCNQRKNNHLINLTLNYMEESQMIGMENFTKREIHDSRSAFSFLRKSEYLLKIIWQQLEPVLEKEFGRNYRSDVVQWNNLGWDNLYCCYAKRPWHFRINIGIYIDFGNGKPYLYFGPGTWKKQFIAILQEDAVLCQEVEKLKKRGWEINDDDSTWWEIYRDFLLNPKSPETLLKEFIPKLRKAVSELKSSRLIRTLENRSYNM